MPQNLGYVGDELHDKLIKDALQYEQDYRLLLTPKFREVTDYWSMYFTQKEDKRAKHERWRSFIPMPYAFHTTETLVATVGDIFNSADPPVQGEGVGPEDVGDARAIERNVDYVLRRNAWPLHLDHLVRGSSVAGMSVGKVTYGRSVVKVSARPRESDFEAWRDAVKEAEQIMGVPAPVDPDIFEQWRQTVIQASGGKLRVPEIPTVSNMSRALYEGPIIERPSLFSLRFDPFVEDIQQQRCFIHRITKSKKWVIDRTDFLGNRPDLPFVGRQVAEALERPNLSEQWEEWERDVSTMLGFDRSEEDRVRDKADEKVEILEVWQQGQDHPFALILNRHAVINRFPDEMPFAHGMVPYFHFAGTPVEGHLMGLSEYQPSKHLYGELDKLRELRMDAVVLSVLPILTKLTTGGVSQEQLSQLQPGDILTVARENAVQMLSKVNPGIMDAFREIAGIKEDIDDTSATWGNVRGASATIGRVSATEAERRVSQALTRQKAKVVRFEEQANRMLIQILGLQYQFGPDETIVNVGGGNPFVNVPRGRFYDAMFMDFRFRGPTRVANRDLTAQNLMTFAKSFANFIRPGEMRELMRNVLESQSIKSVADIVTDQGTAEVLAIMGGSPGGFQPGPMLPPGLSGGIPGLPGAPGQPAPPGAPGGGGGAPPPGLPSEVQGQPPQAAQVTPPGPVQLG